MAKEKGKAATTDRDTAVQFIHTPDSVTLKQNAKGEYAWDIKIYFDSDEGRDAKAPEKVLTRLKEIDKKLHKQYD